MSTWHKLCAALLLALCAVAIAVVHLNHRARKLTTQISRAETDAHKLETGYRQMQLERAQWSASSRVEKIAREQLRMQFPDATRTIHLSTVATSTQPNVISSALPAAQISAISTGKSP
jgi:cell division protein FtsL